MSHQLGNIFSFFARRVHVSNDLFMHDRQKLILNGRALTSMDHGKSLKECGVINFSKVMVLGKRYDPEGDELYKQGRKCIINLTDLALSKLVELSVLIRRAGNADVSF